MIINQMITEINTKTMSPQLQNNYQYKVIIILYIWTCNPILSITQSWPKYLYLLTISPQ